MDADGSVNRRVVLAAAPVAASAAVLAVGCSASGPRAQPLTGALDSASAIPVGGGKVFAEREVVVTQPVAGTFRAFSAICTHEGCLVNSVADGTISCPCHGSEFSIVDGSVVQGPAQRPLPPEKVVNDGGTLRLD
jgi:nitrite reductase/ring-hydroxylating ferredoxin subunit